MPYTPVQFSSFGAGLNLRDKVDVIREDQAIDLLNVEFTTRGGVRQRDGYLEFTSSALTNRVDSIAPYYESDGTRQLLCGCGTRLEALSTAGAVVASATGLTGGPYGFARTGVPGVETAYAGNGSDTLRKWDGAAWTAPTATVDGTAARAMPKAGSVCVQAPDNRLVATAFATTSGGPHGTSSGPSYVYFSNPGAPETWETDGTAGRGANFLQLTPGDGEKIQAAVAWRELMFVFKETRFFVFHGNSTQSNGTPLFNYRVVDTGVGVGAPLAVAVGRDGVYFMSRDGVYRTTGGEAELLSDLVSPMWNGDVSPYFMSSPINHAQITKAAMSWHDGRVYLAVPTGTSSTNNRVLVFDTRDKWWSLWDFAASAVASFRAGDSGDLFFGYAAGTNDVGRQSSTTTNDNGSAIVSRWRSGWADYGQPALEKTIREAELWGSGICTVSVGKDFVTSDAASEVVSFTGQAQVWGDGTDASNLWGNGLTGDLWGPDDQVTTKLARRVAVYGTTLSTTFSNATLNVTWSINRLTHRLRELVER